MIKKVLLSIASIRKKRYYHKLKREGVVLGDNVNIFAPGSTIIDSGYGKRVVIGNNCLITKGCIILAHDYSYAVVNEVYGELPQNTLPTIIGNNVFLGMNSIVLMGTKIGDNTIIGAGSIVSGILDGNSVYAGNPAKKICSLEEYRNKHMAKMNEGAIEYAKQMKERLGRNPKEDEMGFYVQLFSEDKELYKRVQKKYGNVPLKMPSGLKYNSLEEFYSKIGFL